MTAEQRPELPFALSRELIHIMERSREAPAGQPLKPVFFPGGLIAQGDPSASVQLEDEYFEEVADGTISLFPKRNPLELGPLWALVEADGPDSLAEFIQKARADGRLRTVEGVAAGSRLGVSKDEFFSVIAPHIAKILTEENGITVERGQIGFLTYPQRKFLETPRGRRGLLLPKGQHSEWMAEDLEDRDAIVYGQESIKGYGVVACDANLPDVGFRYMILPKTDTFNLIS